MAERFFAQVRWDDGLVRSWLSRDHAWELIDEPEKHLDKRDQVTSVLLSHDGNFMGSLVSFFSDVIDPVLSIRWHKPFICDVVNVLNELQPLACALLDGDVHQHLAAQKYRASETVLAG